MTAERDRRRIGLLIPSSNSVMEVDFYRRVPPHVTVHTGRMFMENTTPEGESRMLDEFAILAAQALATARPDVTVFGCTSAGALRGNEYDRELCRRLGEEMGGPVVSVIASVREAIGRRGARRVGVITPYVDALNDKIRSSLEDDGLEIVGIHGLGITENFRIAEVEPSDIVGLARRSLREVEMDLLFASCTNFRAMDAISPLAGAMGVPVVTSNQAALEATLRALGLEGEPDAKGVGESAERTTV